MKRTTKMIARAGIIASLYVLLSLVTFPVASGAIQFRASEALCILPLIYPETVIALAVGCMLSNLITGCAIFDIVFGSLITLVAGVLTFLIGKFVKNTILRISIGGIFPVLLNAFFLPLVWIWCYGLIEYIYWLQVLFLIVSQAVSVYLLGTPLYLFVKRMKDKGIGFLE
jgi:uncharacterized membrane protein